MSDTTFALAGQPDRRRILTVDLMRIVSALAIFAAHSNMHLGCTYSVLTPFVSQGPVFMIAFFLVSGYTLYRNYAAASLMDLGQMKQFYRKRITSIYPLYLALYILFLLFANTLPADRNLLAAPVELLLLQSTLEGAFGLLHNGGTWFVSCIFFCYLMFPFLLSVIQQLQRKGRIRLLVLFYGVCTFTPIVVATLSLGSIYASPIYRTLEFAIGILVAALGIPEKKPRNGRLALAILLESTALAAAITAMQKAGIGNYGVYGFLCIPAFALILHQLAALDVPVLNRILGSRPVQYANKLTYPFFLAQFFSWSVTRTLEQRFARLASPSNIQRIAVSFLVCLVMTILLYEGVDRPLNRLLKRLPARQLKPGLEA